MHSIEKSIVFEMLAESWKRNIVGVLKSRQVVISTRRKCSNQRDEALISIYRFKIFQSLLAIEL